MIISLLEITTSRFETARRTPPHRKVWTDAPGIFKGSPPSQIEHIDIDRRAMDISCRPERTGTGTVRHHHGADESYRGREEELKRTQQMEWVQRCNNIHNRAEEIVLHERFIHNGMVE